MGSCFQSDGLQEVRLFAVDRLFLFKFLFVVIIVWSCSAFSIIVSFVSPPLKNCLV